MDIIYKVITEDIYCIKDLCNDLMNYQKSKSYIHSEWFDNMNFETRFIPSYNSVKENFLIIAYDEQEIIGYAYSNISSKYTYSGGFATLKPVDFFDSNSGIGDDVGCLSQFYIKDGYRKGGVGTALFNSSIDWLNSRKSIKDIFIFVSNENNNALKFYLNKGFKKSVINLEI